MRILLAAFVLISVCLVAQEVPLPAPNRDPDPYASRPKTYQGCVIRTNGKIMLTDASNTDYQLVSSTVHALESYVGQEVRVTATQIYAGDPSSDEMSVATYEPPNEPATLDVEEITKVADHCSSPK